MEKLNSHWDFLHHPESMIRISVVATEGSAPRHRHSAMVLTIEGDNFSIAGSIGGGALEHLALQQAKDFLHNKASADWQRLWRKISLGSDLRQSCGGTVELLFEYLGEAEKAYYKKLLTENASGFLAIPYEAGAPISHRSRPANELDIYCQPILLQADKLYLFGAGHVGRAVAYHISPLHFSLHWVDFDEARFCDNADDLCDEKWIAENPADKVKVCSPDSYFLVMSHSHALDYDIVAKILQRGDFRFLGLIGSNAKASRFRKSLAKDGHDEALIQKLISPIGLVQTPDNTPHSIAVSAVAQLLQVQATFNA